MCKVLLVDDDRQVCELEAEALRALSFDVQVAHTLENAVRTAREHAFDAIVTEIDLRLARRRHPRLGQGLEFVRRLRRIDLKTRIIVFTTFAGEIYRDASCQAGAGEYLTKDVGVDRLAASLRSEILA
jgi:ActR/RegA family two-component response regulator